MVLPTGNRWGDEDEDVYLPPRSETEPDENGIRTIIEWKFNENNKKVKTTKKVKQINVVTRINKKVMDRREWEKFGAAMNSDSSNVTILSPEDVSMEDPNADVVLPGEKKEEESIFSGVKNASIVVCRHCGMVGDHWTLKCPYKDTPPDEIPHRENKGDSKEKIEGQKETGLAGAFSSDNGKYVPPSMRKNEGETSLSSNTVANDRDFATLRVTNISTDTRDNDLQELFRPFGPISRVYLAKDRETMQSRGFAFVSFTYREDAEKALNALQGYGYDHLILKLEWAKPSGKEDAGSTGTTFRSGYGKALPQNIAPSRK